MPRYIVIDLAPNPPKVHLNTTSLSRAALAASKLCVAANQNVNEHNKRVPLKVMRALFESREWQVRGPIALLDG